MSKTPPLTWMSPILTLLSCPLLSPLTTSNLVDCAGVPMEDREGLVVSVAMSRVTAPHETGSSCTTRVVS
jgi:hypothetical protein